MARDFNINAHHAATNIIHAAHRAQCLQFSIACCTDHIRDDIAVVREYLAQANAQLDELVLTLKAAELAKAAKVAA